MSVTSVKEDFQVRTGAHNYSLGGKNVTTYRRRFIVQTNDVNDGPKTVMAAAGIPQPQDGYKSGNESDPAALCIKIEPAPRQSEPTTWDVVCDYSTDLPPGPNTGNPGTQPPDRPTKYFLSYTTITRILSEDFSTPPRPILNSAGQEFHPSLEQELYLPVVQIQRYEPTFLFQRAKWGNGSVNMNTFTILGNFVGKYEALGRMRQAPYFENGLSYWDTTYEIIINRLTWLASPLDQGTLQLVPDPSAPTFQEKTMLRAITDQTGNPVNQPVKLDGKGKKLAQGQDPVYFDGLHGHPDPFNVYPLIMFDNF